ncbi:hypothetical protein BDR07DRAFT_1378972 [Suillus spraguei]|nr:hypothetical protein BDR07DRAFT_1378972 [Suillus spraguei]
MPKASIFLCHVYMNVGHCMEVDTCLLGCPTLAALGTCDRVCWALLDAKCLPGLGVCEEESLLIAQKLDFGGCYAQLAEHSPLAISHNFKETIQIIFNPVLKLQIIVVNWSKVCAESLQGVRMFDSDRNRISTILDESVSNLQEQCQKTYLVPVIDRKAILEMLFISLLSFSTLLKVSLQCLASSVGHQPRVIESVLELEVEADEEEGAEAVGQQQIE